MEFIPPNRNLMPSVAEMEMKPAEQPATTAYIRVHEKVLMKFDTIEALHRNSEITGLPRSGKDHRHCYHLFVVISVLNDKVSLRSLQTAHYDILVKRENVIVYKRDLILSSPAMLKAADTFDADLKKQISEFHAYIDINEAITNAISAFVYIDLDFNKQIRTPFQTPFTPFEESIRRLNEAYPTNVYGGVAKMKQAVVAESLAMSYLLLAKLHEKWAETLRQEANDPPMDKTMSALIKLCENEAKECLFDLELQLFTWNGAKRKYYYFPKIDSIRPAGFTPETRERNGEQVVKLAVYAQVNVSLLDLHCFKLLHAEEDVVYKSPEGVRYLGSSQLPIWDPRNAKWLKPRSLNFHNNRPVRFLIPNETHALLVFGCRGFACRFCRLTRETASEHEKESGHFVKKVPVESEENAAVESEENVDDPDELKTENQLLRTVDLTKSRHDVSEWAETIKTDKSIASAREIVSSIVNDDYMAYLDDYAINEAYPANVYGGVAKIDQPMVAESLAMSYLLLAKLHEKWAKTLRQEANDAPMDKTMPAFIKLCENEAKKRLFVLELQLFTWNAATRKYYYFPIIDSIRPAGFTPETRERNGEQVVRLAVHAEGTVSLLDLHCFRLLHAEGDVVYKSPEGVRYLGSSQLPIWDPRNAEWEKPRSLKFHNNRPVRFLIPNGTHALLVFGCRGFACRFYGLHKTSPKKHEKNTGHFVVKEEEEKEKVAVESEENVAIESEENAAVESEESVDDLEELKTENRILGTVDLTKSRHDVSEWPETIITDKNRASAQEIVSSIVNDDYMTYLDDSAMEYYLQMLVLETAKDETNPTCLCFPPHWYVGYKNHGFEIMSRWTDPGKFIFRGTRYAKEKDCNIFMYDRIFIPLLLRQVHWVVVIVNVQEKTLHLFDSPRNFEYDSILAEHIIDYLAKEQEYRLKTTFNKVLWRYNVINEISLFYTGIKLNYHHKPLNLKLEYIANQ